MNKKLLGSMVVAAAIFTGYSAYDAQNENELTGAVLVNVEALANNESNNNLYQTMGYCHGTMQYMCTSRETGEYCWKDCI